ncbi:MAG: site-2 protease family protein [Patescibacteria group bacterium]
MPLNLISDNPLYFIAWLAAILVAFTTHEFSHALAATVLGDPTPKKMGRLTLNPIAHIDFVGLLMLVLIGFGWGKPVPFNPYNLKYQKWGGTLVALAGPFANLLNIALWGIVLKIVVAYNLLPPANLLILFLNLLIVLNVTLLIFNLIPVPPLDGSHFLFDILRSPKYERIKIFLETRGPFLLLGLIILDNLAGLGVFGRLFGGATSLVYRIFF